MPLLTKYSLNQGPFDPSFGGIPKILLQRKSLLNDCQELLKNSPSTMSLFITGLRGSGKSVFTNYLLSTLKTKNTIIIRLDNKSNHNESNLLTNFEHQL